VVDGIEGSVAQQLQRSLSAPTVGDKFYCMQDRYHQPVTLAALPPNIYLVVFPTNRAENWNLAAPLATCNLHVERRDDGLVLEFRK
jgi:hypothetical protein